MTPDLWIVTHLRRLRPSGRIGPLLPLVMLAAAVSLPLPSFAQYWSQAWPRPASRSTYSSSSYATVSPEDEQQVLQLLNRERQARGLAPLTLDRNLTEAARLHSQRMAAANEIGHQLGGEAPLDLRLRRGDLRFDIDGENVAEAADAFRAHAALMRSPGHRANILDPEYTSVGIGVVSTGREVFVTQDFAHLLPQISVRQAEDQIAWQLNRGRSARGIPELRRIPAPELRSRACEMAAADSLNPGAAMLPHVESAVAFTALDLGQLPDSLRHLQSSPARAFSVGACYRSSASYQNPVFWFIVVTYL